MLSVVRYDSFADLRAEWSPLVAAAEARGPFLSWEWQNLWWQTFGGDAELWLLAVREGDALVGIAPFMVRQGRLTFACGQDVCDYLDVIARRGRDYERSISADYLGGLNKLYEKWISGFTLCPVLTVPTDDLNYVAHPGHLNLVARKIEPRRVRRGSASRHQTGPHSSSASARMVRNFSMVKTRPSSPMRCWR